MSEQLDIQPTGAVRSGDLNGERWDLITGVVIRPLLRRAIFDGYGVFQYVARALEDVDNFLGFVGAHGTRRELALEAALGCLANAIQIDEGGDAMTPFPELALKRLAQTCHEGAVKYNAHNWLRGFPIWSILNHGKRHLALWLSGNRDEDHLGHALWNMMAALHYWNYRPELCTGLCGRNYTYPEDAQ